MNTSRWEIPDPIFWWTHVDELSMWMECAEISLRVLWDPIRHMPRSGLLQVVFFYPGTFAEFSLEMARRRGCRTAVIDNQYIRLYRRVRGWWRWLACPRKLVKRHPVAVTLGYFFVPHLIEGMLGIRRPLVAGTLTLKRYARNREKQE